MKDETKFWIEKLIAELRASLSIEVLATAERLREAWASLFLVEEVCVDVGMWLRDFVTTERVFVNLRQACKVQKHRGVALDNGQ